MPNNNKKNPDVNNSEEGVVDSKLILKNTQAKYKAVLEGTNTGTWEWNIQTGETVFNERWAQIIGYSLKELEPTTIDTWTEHTHPIDLKKCQEKLESHFRGEQDSYECECRMKHKDGHWVWVLDRGTVMEWTEKGDPLLMFGTHTDITRLKKTQEALEQQKNALQQRNKEINCFFKMSEIVQSQEQTLEEMLQQFVSIIPPAFQNPLLTCAKITFKGKQYETKTFIETPVMLSSDIIFHGETAGSLKVYLKKQTNQEKTQSFLETEKRLIDSLSERIGRIAERKDSENKLSDNEKNSECFLKPWHKELFIMIKQGKSLMQTPLLKESLD